MLQISESEREKSVFTLHVLLKEGCDLLHTNSSGELFASYLLILMSTNTLELPKTPGTMHRMSVLLYVGRSEMNVKVLKRYCEVSLISA